LAEPEHTDGGEPVTYSQSGRVAKLMLNRPQYRNAQNSALLYALDGALQRAVEDDDIGVVVLGGNGPHFSAGHDIGTPGRDVDVGFPRRATVQPDHTAYEGAHRRWLREREVYLEMCRRWRTLPKPVIAMVQGGCIAGGLMIAWSCDLIIASEDAFFSDPVLRMGAPGVEFLAHPWVLGPRVAKEMLFTGGRISAERAYQLGMVNRVVPRVQLDEQTMNIAERVGSMPEFALLLTKQAVNQAEDLMGMRAGMDAAFGLHQLAHAHNAELGDYIMGMNARAMRESE
jgi:enoyl-CoA hydratase